MSAQTLTTAAKIRARLIVSIAADQGDVRHAAYIVAAEMVNEAKALGWSPRTIAAIPSSVAKIAVEIVAEMMTEIVEMAV